MTQMFHKLFITSYFICHQRLRQEQMYSYLQVLKPLHVYDPSLCFSLTLILEPNVQFLSMGRHSYNTQNKIKNLQD
jgi:hypothetical protein